MVVDSGLHASNKAQLHWMKEKRSMPASFKLFVGTDFTHDCSNTTFDVKSYSK
jgi:hypothetical protein